ncbi:guanylate kinase [Gimibacter soli]|uniref:Guanylate kinase n=1 Tax=Gimibacter soli TaxID=3024400 RepID=A0AAE9XU85_9PROT|nr:guanylate kinase [Gimibacter soli]WCL52794.1 guanylate kinase [Gimibacter soli]
MSLKNLEKRRGVMLVLSSPSGAGKTTLTRRLLENDPQIVSSVSATTREARPGEVHGKDYFFISHDRFKDMVDNSEFLEHANVFDNRYGTPRGPVMEALKSGKDIIFDIDWQGTQQLAESAADDLVRVFILPPSIGDLEKRLRSRAQDSDAVVEKRMARSADEISHWSEYDYVLVNDNVDATFQKLVHILEAERLKRRRRIGLSDFARELMEEGRKR